MAIILFCMNNVFHFSEFFFLLHKLFHFVTFVFRLFICGSVYVLLDLLFSLFLVFCCILVL